MLLILLYFYTRKRNKRERSVILGVLLFFGVRMPALGGGWWCRVGWVLLMLPLCAFWG
jgi:hypothetical protein